MTLSRIVEKLPTNENLIYVKASYAYTHHSHKKTVSSWTTAGKSYDNKSSDKVNLKEESQSEFQLYSAVDIESSQGVELKKHLYWNTRIQDFAEDLKTKTVTKFEVYGIIDVEWTQKKTELLKVLADQTVRILQEKNIDSTSTSLSQESTSVEKEVMQALERVEKSEFLLNCTYKKIEALNKEKCSQKIRSAH